MSASADSSVPEFLAEAEEILESVAEDLTALETTAEEGDPDPEVVNSIFRGAHSLKGIAGMFGFAQITELSHKMETLLDAVRMGRVACQRGVLDLLFEGLDLVKFLCSRLAAGETPEDPRVSPFVERLLAAAAAPQGPSAQGVGTLGLTEDVLQVLTEYEIHRIQETLGNPKRNLFRVRASFPLESFDTDLESLTAALKACGEIISTLPSPGEAATDCLDFDLLVGAKVSREDVERATGEFRARVEPLDGEGGAGNTAAVTHEAGAAAAASADKVPSPRDAPSSPAAGGGDLRSLTKTVRVDLPKLDTLMNLVGELVLVKGRVQMVADRLRSRMGVSGEALDLSKVQKELERKLSDLQQSVMEVRMVPLGQLFTKLHRVMRKLLQGSPKEVALEISGAETELDKLIVEDLSDPLIHVIRNAVDHGIEEPEIRLAKGKPARGTVRIGAHQRGNHVVIEVSDDGAGLSRERIRQKALDRGLLDPQEQIGDQELLDLVFLPGFSTKEEVTEVSGRGVGMDVLRKNISAISGMIELWSVEGEGTKVTIVLPITLAIIQALLVRVGEQAFAIPLNSVLETLALEPAQVKALEGRPVLRLRDATLPLARLDRMFGLDGHDRFPTYAVVIGVAEKRVAFGVDDLMNQQDVVIKGLGRHLQGLRGFAGATDLGDQKTVLVLDVAALVDEVFEGE